MPRPSTASAATCGPRGYTREQGGGPFSSLKQRNIGSGATDKADGGPCFRRAAVVDRAVSPTRTAPVVAQARSTHAHFTAWRVCGAARCNSATRTQHTRLQHECCGHGVPACGAHTQASLACNDAAERVTCHACRWCPKFPPTACSRRCVVARDERSRLFGSRRTATSRSASQSSSRVMQDTPADSGLRMD